MLSNEVTFFISGGSIALIVIFYFVYKKTNKGQIQKSGDHSKNIQIGGNQVIGNGNDTRAKKR